MNKYPWTIVAGVIMIDDGSPFLVNNTIDEIFHGSSMSIGCCGGSGVTLLNNTIYGEVYSEQIPFTIEGNIINGTLLMGSNGYHPDHPVDTKITVISNTIDSIEIDVGKATIQNNLIRGDITLGTVVAVNAGPETTFTAVSALIQNNTINGTIHYQSSASSTVNYNNLLIQNNQKTIRLSTSVDVDATNNWWGTIDQSTIANAIYDFNNDFNLGTVNFVPFLTAPSPQAPSPNIPTPTSNPSSSSAPTVSSTPVMPEFPLVTTLAIIVIISTVAVSAYGRKLKHA